MKVKITLINIIAVLVMRSLILLLFLTTARGYWEIKFNITLKNGILNIHDSSNNFMIVNLMNNGEL